MGDEADALIDQWMFDEEDFHWYGRDQPRRPPHTHEKGKAYRKMEKAFIEKHVTKEKKPWREKLGGSLSRTKNEQ